MRERYQEYLRRNLLVAKAAGAKVDVSMVLARLESQSRPPQWLVNDLRRILERVDPLPGELARWRDTEWTQASEVEREIEHLRQQRDELLAILVVWLRALDAASGVIPGGDDPDDDGPCPDRRCTGF